jgi:tetratricopeptide (TPR) repeat protein
MGMYMLPRGVVDNGNDSLLAKEAEDSIPSDSTSLALTETHNRELSDEMSARINSIKARLATASPAEHDLLMDSLSGYFESSSLYDSAAIYYEKLLQNRSDEKYILKTADLYFEAYSFAMNRDRASYLGGKARQYYLMILERDSTRLDIKNKIAMTFVSSSNPMRGITMLREILTDDPENQDAIFNMGLLSLQSGQYERAMERFEQLTKINSGNLQGQFYLGLCYLELGDTAKAVTQFQLVKSLGNDPTILATVQSYLNELK